MARANKRALPRIPSGRARAPSVDERIHRLTIGGTLSLARNEQAIRAAAAIISRNTGRQFTIDDGPSGRVLTRRG